MIKLESISIELKKILNEGDDFIALQKMNDLIEKIDQEIKENNAAYKPSDKKQIAAIKKYLNNAGKTRPILQAFTPYDGWRVAICDSYTLYVLDKKYLPFKVAFNNEITEEEKNKYLKENNIDKNDVIEGNYPGLKNLIPEEMDQVDYFKFDVDSFLAWYKVQDKKEKHTLYNIGDDLLVYNIESKYLKNTIDILKLEGSVVIEFYGDKKPCIIRKGSEIALMLPAITY